MGICWLVRLIARTFFEPTCFILAYSLRSMMAASKLYEKGYRKLGWLAGGFNRAADGDFPDVEGPEELQYATIGGVSYYFLKLLILLQAVGKSKD